MANAQHRTPETNASGLHQELIVLDNWGLKHFNTTVTATSESGDPFTADRLLINDNRSSWQSGSLSALADSGVEYISLIYVFDRPRSVGSVGILGNTFLPWRFIVYEGAFITSAELGSVEYTHPEILRPFGWPHTWDQGMPSDLRTEWLEEKRFVTGASTQTISGGRTVEIRFDIRGHISADPDAFARTLGEDTITARHILIGDPWTDQKHQSVAVKSKPNYKDLTKVSRGPNGDPDGITRQGYNTTSHTLEHADLPDTRRRIWPEMEEFYQGKNGGPLAQVLVWMDPNDVELGYKNFGFRRITENNWRKDHRSTRVGTLKLEEVR